ncbi:unnamed protein product [Symbiodinium sp. CCMP2456]|nr:unnamed protein product [Symbiodinium sp. CCMP2456]
MLHRCTFLLALCFFKGGGSISTSCKTLGCGGRDNTCSCTTSCWSFSSCCDDYGTVCPEQSPTIQLGDVNMLITTDLHSWIEGRTHESLLNASLAHVVSALDHLRKAADVEKRDVFFFDNGDINDGTGLSATAPDHVEFLAPVMQSARYDALNLGNHELYQRNGHGIVEGPACPVVGLNESGYIASWQGRYLTSNVVWSSTQQPIGNRYAVVEGKFGTKLLVFGFLYNMEDHCDAVSVLDVEQTLASKWFIESLKAHRTLCDGVVVLAHMDFRDALVDKIWAAVRQGMGPSKPIQILAGHSHIRGYRRLDSHASVFEAGCKLDTVGFLSYSFEANGLRIDHSNITGNVQQLAGAVNRSVSNLSTAAGARTAHAINTARGRAGSDQFLGCASQRYRLLGPLDNNSLWTLYMNQVLPGALLDTPSSQIAIIGDGTLSYDIFPGPVNVDDVYKASPFANFWLKLESIPGSDVAKLLSELIYPTKYDLPPYFITGAPVPSSSYDLVFCEYDTEAIVGRLSKILGRRLEARLYKPLLNTSSVLNKWFEGQPCASQELLV